MGKDAGLFMIGDPKQSIYSFRGADVFAYIQAKKDSLEQSAAYTMTTNYRSTPPMVEAVNRLFGRDNAFVLGKDIVQYCGCRQTNNRRTPGSAGKSK